MGLKKNVTGFRQGYETPAGRTEAPLGSGAHSGLQSHFFLLRFWGETHYMAAFGGGTTERVCDSMNQNLTGTKRHSDSEGSPKSPEEQVHEEPGVVPNGQQGDEHGRPALNYSQPPPGHNGEAALGIQRGLRSRGDGVWPWPEKSLGTVTGSAPWVRRESQRPFSGTHPLTGV